MTKLEIRAAAAVGLLYIVRMLGLFMVLPVLPLVAPDIAGATPFLIGVAIGAYGVSQACLQIPLGMLSDRYGRKPIIFAGLAVFVLGSLIAGLSDSVGGIILGRFLQGCGAIASTLLALVSDVTRVEHRGKAMAIVGISIGASFGLALILGPYLATLGGIEAVFLFSAAAGLLGMLVLLTAVPTPLIRTHNPQSNLNIARVTSVLADPGLRRTSVGVFMLHYLLMSSFIVLPGAMRMIGIADEDHHWLYFWLLLGAFVLMTPLMWLSDRPRFTRMLMLVMIGGFVTSTIVLSGAVNYYVVLGAMLLFFMAFNLLEVILPALVSRMAQAGDRGTAMGVYSTAQFAGGAAGGIVGGLLISEWDMAHLMYANAVACGMWFLYAFGMSRPGNYRTVTCPIKESDTASASQVADALLSVQGVVDVALVMEEKLAYLKVDADHYDKNALAAIGASIPARR